MPQQLIYTSSPRGVTPGRSGYCTVARSSTMRDALASRLEQLSYYQHLSLAGGEERPVCAYRIVDIRGTRYHVLSRLLDAGLDYTNRTNFLAHHLVLTPEEAAQLSSPPLLFLHWDGWHTRWQGDPRMLDGESWGNLTTIASTSTIPAHTWARLTGQGVNGFGLLDLPGGAWLQADGLTETDLLSLLAESLSLLTLRERRSNPTLTTWQVTFTTAYQEQDSPNDFRWRCLHSGTSPARTGGGQSVASLLQVRPRQHTEEEQRFAESGPTPVSMVQPPQDQKALAGDSVRFQAQAQGIPYPTYEWFLDGVLIAGQTGPQCVIERVEAAKSQPRQFRVIVRASNGYGTAEATARLEVRPNLRIASPPPAPVARRKVEPAGPPPSQAQPSPPPRLDILMLVQNILDAWTTGRRQTAEPSLQEIRRRQSELASLPDPVLEKFLNDSKETSQEELVRMLRGERARRPKRTSKPLVAIGVVLVIALISLGAWQAHNHWPAKAATPPETPATGAPTPNGPGTHDANQASKNDQTPELAGRSDHPAASQLKNPPSTAPTPNTAVRQSNGTNYFLLAGKSPQIPNGLTKLLEQLLPAGATSFTATNLQFWTEDLSRWQELQKPKAFVKPRSSPNSLEFWDSEQPAWKAIFERRPPATPVHLQGMPVSGGKVVFGENKVGERKIFFRLVFVPETTSNLPERNAHWKDSQLTFDEGTIKQLETLFDDRDSSHKLELIVSFGRGRSLSMNTTIEVTKLNKEYPFPIRTFIKTNRDRFVAQAASWDALEKLVGEVKELGDTVLLETIFPNLQTSEVGMPVAKERLRECEKLILKKLLPEISFLDNQSIPSPNEAQFKEIKSISLQQSLRRFYMDHRKPLGEFLGGPLPNSAGNRSHPRVLDARKELDQILKLLGKMEENPANYLQGSFVISINSKPYPVVNLKFQSP